ncbi:MAG: M48 family metallopeptidase [Clostridia bacterium]|nr:M48 family metallopeptidase [Clostridia bacterium]
MIRADRIIRSKRKTLSVAIDHFGRVTVRAPIRCDEKRIFAFLAEKENWILRKKEQIEGAGMRLPPENLDGYRLLLLGEFYTLRYVNDRSVRLDSVENILYLPDKNPRERLVKWLKENAKRIFTEATAEKAREMDVEARSVSVTSARTRWGSCSQDNSIRYSFRLLYMKKELVEYVITHELAHIKHKNHSPAFWREVEKYVPDWREKRKRLKSMGAYMEVF